MRPTDLANPAWLTAMVRHHHRDLGLERLPVAVVLLDVRIRNPHLPDSQRCQGWATVRVRAGATAGDAHGPIFLLRSEDSITEGSTGTTLPGLALRFWRFPDDPALPALRSLTDPERVRALLPGRLAADHRIGEVRVVRWQPGVSATVRCALVGNRDRSVLYAKVLDRRGLPAVDAIQRALYDERSAGLRVAEPLGADPVHGVLWTREVVGRPLLDGLRGGDPTTVQRCAHRAGRSLAGLHASGVTLTDCLVEPEDVAAEAAKKARKIAWALPRHRAAVERLSAVAEGPVGAISQPSRPLHGDFHVDQMLLTDDDLVLLDLDEMVTGDPALDLAELAVDLGMRVLPSVTKDGFLSVLRDSYENAGGTWPADDVLRGYAAAELLNRCYRHLRRPVPRWEVALGAALGAADVVLAGIPGGRAGGRISGRNIDEVRT